MNLMETASRAWPSLILAWKLVDDYIDEFSELVEEAGYSDGLSIVMKFRKGLDRDIQDHIAEMVQGRPEDDDPEGWYTAARVLDTNRAVNQAFHGTYSESPNTIADAKSSTSDHLHYSGISCPDITIPQGTCVGIQHPDAYGD
jgi:hypothetical protein